MRICRIKYTVLGLLVYYLQCAFTWSCGSEFEDVASKTVMADLVLEGTSVRKVAMKSKPGYYIYKFRIRSLIKGNFTREYLASIQHLSKETTPSNSFHLPDVSRNHENAWNNNKIRHDNYLHNNKQRHVTTQFSYDTYTNRRNHPRFDYGEFFRVRRSVRSPHHRSVRNVRSNVRKRQYVRVKQFGPSEDLSDCTASTHSVKLNSTYLLFLRLPRRPSLSPSEATTRRQTTTIQHKPQRSKHNRNYKNNPRHRHRYRRSMDRYRRNYPLRSNRKATYKSRRNNRSRKAKKKKPLTIYSMTSMPVPLKKKVRAIAHKHKCLHCKKKAKVINISPINDVVIRKKVNITCKVIGFPRPEVFWLKNGLILSEDHITIETKRISLSRLDSVLVFDGTTENDTGQYQCYGVNVVGESDLVKTNLSITSEDKIPFSVRCPFDDYCFNGGVCYKLKQKDSHFCSCKGDYVGVRCAERNTSHHVLLMGRRKRRRRSSHSHPQPSHHYLNR